VRGLVEPLNFHEALWNAKCLIDVLVLCPRTEARCCFGT